MKIEKKCLYESPVVELIKMEAEQVIASSVGFEYLEEEEEL